MWNYYTAIKYPLLCMFAGIASGMLGIGGGIIINNNIIQKMLLLVVYYYSKNTIIINIIQIILFYIQNMLL